ncbi:MAG: hypothetical protein ACAI44_29315 [Candidatus Sericytochromatia bacterium]
MANQSRHVLILGLVTGCLSLPAAAANPPVEGAQNPLQRSLQTTTPAENWKIQAPDKVRFGQVTISKPAEQPSSLQVNRLMARQPVPRQARVPGILTPEFVKGAAPLGVLSAGLPARMRTDYGAYMREPAYAEAGVRTLPGGPAVLSIGAKPQPPGFCGLWMRIYDPDAGTAVDASTASEVGFWIKGTPGLQVEVKLGDIKWQIKQDSLLIGSLGQFLPGGRLNGEWQPVRVPIPKNKHNLKPAELTQLVLDIKGNRPGELMVHSVALLQPGSQLPARLPETSGPEPSRGVWLWQSHQFLDPVLRAQMLESLGREGVRQIFVQLAGIDGAHPGELKLVREAWQPAIEAAQAKGIRVHALDGDPRYVLPDWHAGVLATARGVLAYNQAVPEKARFAGIQYDIEPYLLPGYFGERQQELMQGLVRLVDGLSTLRQPDFKLGLAAPFWLDSADEFTGEWPWLEFRGRQRSISEHLIERVDYLALMNYRTQIEGQTGLLANIRQEMALANRMGKGIWIGLETTALPHETSYVFTGRPHRGWPQPSARAQLAIARSQADTWRIWWIPGGETPPPAPEDPVWYWPLKQYSDTAPDQLSFATLGWPKLRSTVEELEYQLQGAPSFQGVILHDQPGVEKLLAEKKTGSQAAG